MELMSSQPKLCGLDDHVMGIYSHQYHTEPKKKQTHKKPHSEASWDLSFWCTPQTFTKGERESIRDFFSLSISYLQLNIFG